MKKILCIIALLLGCSAFAHNFDDGIYKCISLCTEVGNMKYDDHCIQIRGNQFMVLNAKGVVIQKAIMNDSPLSRDNGTIIYEARLADTYERVVLMYSSTEEKGKITYSYVIIYHYGKNDEKWEIFDIE